MVRRREIFSWSLYDFANSAFTTLIVTFIFSRYFAEVVAADPLQGAVLWTRAVNASAVIVALVMPVLGAMADYSGHKKLFLGLITVESVAFTALLFFVGPGQAGLAAVLFIAANVGFEGAQVFYNGFLPELSTRETIGRISGNAWALGYIGGLLALLAGLWMVRGGLPAAGHLNVRATALLVAGWWAVFSIPLFLFVRERAPRRHAPVGRYVTIGFARVGETLGHLRQFREAAKLLVARLIYNDGLTTVFAMAAIYVSAVFGMTTADVIVLGLVVNVAAGIGAFALGFLDDVIGGKRTIMITLVVLAGATALGSAAPGVTAFWIAAVIIGLMVGPAQSASRSLLARFVPESKHAEFFGFYAFSGKLSSIAGPFTYGLLLEITGSHRIAMGSILAFFIVGLAILLTVDEREGVAAAQSYVGEDAGEASHSGAESA
jgi:MFS transporter, UMF1 family